MPSAALMLGAFAPLPGNPTMSTRIPATLIAGDGIGPEIVDATLAALDALGAPFDWDRQIAGLEGVTTAGDPLPEATLTSITGYRHNKSYTLYDQTGLGPFFTVLPPSGVPDSGFNFTAAQLAGVGSSLLFAEPVNFIEQGTYFTQELRAASNNNDSRFSWIFGGFFLSSKVHQLNRFWGQSLVLGTLSGESRWDDTGHNSDVAVFGQLGYKLTDSLKFEAGVRYTHDRKYGNQQGIIVSTSDIYHPADAAPLTPLTTNFNAPYGSAWNDWTPQATLTWKPNRDMMLYATVSRGFKGGLGDRHWVRLNKRHQSPIGF